MHADPSRPPLLEVEDLRVHFAVDQGAELRAVDGVSFQIPRGRTLALVGESGCGKSVTSYALLRLIQPPGRIAGGSIRLRSERLGLVDVAALTEKDDPLYAVRGGVVSMIFQEPMSALSPVHTIGDQIMEAVLLHQPVTRAEARRRCVEMLGKVGLSTPERRLDQYPHELSGGMRQRVVIAMALVCRPELLIADEPTTALDVTLQAQVLGLIKTLQREIGCAVLFITHDFGVVAQMADEVAVMYLGRIVEQGPVREILRAPAHPYTQGLLRSLPGLCAPGSRLESIEGTVPSLQAIPAGCPFHPRCGRAVPGRCDRGAPPAMVELGQGRRAACLLLADEKGRP